MNARAVKLVALTYTGNLLHIVADFQIDDEGKLFILTVCGKVLSPALLLDVTHNQVTCGRCRSVSVQYNHHVGYIKPAFDNEFDEQEELPF